MNGDRFADLERLARPALAREAIRVVALALPRDDLPIRLGHVQIDPDVRVLPLDLGHRAFQGHRLVRIELSGSTPSTTRELAGSAAHACIDAA